MILQNICPIQIDHLPSGIGLENHRLAFLDPSIGRLGVVYGMNAINEVNPVFSCILFLDPPVVLNKRLLGFNIGLAGNMFGLLVRKIQLVQKA